MNQKYMYIYMSAYICREIQNNKRVSLFFIYKLTLLSRFFKNVQG
jgi:hypothetical protein